MDDREYADRLASIARVVDMLRGHPAGRCTTPSPALIDELTHLVDQLRRDLDDAPGDAVSGRRRRAADGPAALASTSVARKATASTATRPSRMTDDRWTGRVHGVHFARTHEHAVAAVVDMICDAIYGGRAVVLVVTGLHRRWIEDDLHRRGARLCPADLHVLDATTTLSELLVDGAPSRERFRSVVGTLVADVAEQSPVGVSVYGEMVGLLWERGDAVAAMRLEHFWNELQDEVPFTLMCGYLLDRHTSRANLDPIRRLHSHVM